MNHNSDHTLLLSGIIALVVLLLFAWYHSSIVKLDQYQGNEYCMLQTRELVSINFPQKSQHWDEGYLIHPLTCS